MNFNSPVTREDIKSYLDNSLLARLAEVIHRNIFQPIDDLIDRIDVHFTKKMVESELQDR